MTAGEGVDAYAGCDLVLEAVFEELDVKRRVLGGLEAVVSPECLLVTNTSSLSVAAMAEGLAHPERVVGLHFFNPVAVLPLVEVVRTQTTDDVSLATAWDVTRRLGKRGVLVKDAPAFVVNRMLTRQSTVLMQALEAGSTFEETDEAALRLGIPMPPSALLAMVGPQVANHVLHTLHDAFPDRFPLSTTLQALADGDFPALEQRDDRPSVDEIHERILEALADEARQILDEGVVGSGGRAGRVPDPRRGLPVLPRRDHEAPRPDRRLPPRLRRAARRRLRPIAPTSGCASLRGAATLARERRPSELPSSNGCVGNWAARFEAAAHMQESTVTQTTPSGPLPDLETAAHRAERWFGEPFLHPGEDADVALAPGTARRRALDDALEEIEAGNRTPSPGWKVRYGLMLGLERVLAAETPTTAAGTALRRHQIDALAGMLTELIAATQRSVEENGNGNGERQRRGARRGGGGRGGRRASSTTGPRSPRSPASPARTPAPPAATASATRPRPGRRSRRPASSRRPAISAS